jgi:hypothetical protein
MGSDKQTDTEENSIVRPCTFYYYYCNLIKEGRPKKWFFVIFFFGNEAEVKKMTHRTLLEMMRSIYPEGLSVYWGVEVNDKKYISKSYGNLLSSIIHRSPFTTTTLENRISVFVFQILICSFLIQSCTTIFARHLGIPIAGSGPIILVDDPALASSSAFSFPSKPACPGIQVIFTLFLSASFLRCLHSQ